MLQDGAGVNCPECGQSAAIVIYTPTHAYYECADGHPWRENYTDQDGALPRPDNTVVSIEDLLSPDQTSLYQRILAEIESDSVFFQNAEPLAIINRLKENCLADERDIAVILKKVALFYNATKGG